MDYSEKIWFAMEKKTTSLETIFGANIDVSVDSIPENDINIFIRGTKNEFLDSINFDSENNILIFQFKRKESLKTIDFYCLEKDMTNHPFYKERLFKEGYIFDENKSVKWNREQVEIRNKEIKDMKIVERKFENLLIHAIETILIEQVLEDYKEYNISEDAARVLFNKAYENGHACGYSDVKTYFTDYLDMAVDFCKKMNFLK